LLRRITAQNRLVVYSVIFLCFYIFIFSYSTILDISSEDKNPSPYGIDFAAYYTAGQMVTSGHADNIYNVSKHHDALEKVLNRKIPFFLAWVYPPTFLLIVVPFSYLPYYFALALWLAITFAFAIFATYLLVLKYKKIALLVCGFPGVLMNLHWGQNGFMNTALLGLGIYFVETNPLMSGLMFGLMTYKPQLAFFPLLFLLLVKKWKVLFWSIFFSLITALASGIIFGYSIWINFFNNFFHSSSTLLSSVWETTAGIQPTLYSALRFFGVAGYTLKITLFFIFIAIMISSLWVWKKTDRLSIKGSILILGTFLTMPYYAQYDLMLLSIPFILLSYDFLEYGNRPYEIAVLGALWLMPMINWPLVILTRVQICPFVLMTVLAMVIIRVKKSNVNEKIYNNCEKLI